MLPRFTETEVASALGVPTVEFLGAGSFGDTWKVANHAVKIICDDTYPPARVAREVSGLMRVDSPHIVKLIQSGVISLGGNERPAFTFEYVPGGDLQKKIDMGHRPSSGESESLLLGLLTGLYALHGADGTVHRDIKPGNVALRDGNWNDPVILDLGLAKSMSEATFTRYPGRIGTEPFMAPEQLIGNKARKAADLFAVGVTVRLAITGRHPFYEGSTNLTIDEAVRKIENGPEPLAEVLPTSTRAVLDRLVSPRESERGSARSNLRKLGVTVD
ncbi:MAG: serine/threonine protein kinase [Rhodococcus sp. (in: high G+C Gram-positive bacteria)]|nr:MAG: serine/threonine protein kinase [Rhodococcus sp. (in: high G+C Gram-positive bacteria)]